MRHLDFSPDGKVLVSAGGSWLRPSEVRIWDVSTGKLLRAIPHKSDVADVEFSPDGETLGIVSDGTLRLWSTRSWKLKRTLQAKNDYMGSVAFSPDGKYIATGGGLKITKTADGRMRIDTLGKIRLWNAQSGKLRLTLHNSYGPSDVAFLPDSSMLAAVIYDSEGGVRLWDIKTGRLKQKFFFSEAGNIAVSSDGVSIAATKWFLYAGDLYAAVQVWDTHTGKKKWLRRLKGVVAITFLPNHDHLAIRTSADDEDTLKIAYAPDSRIVAESRRKSGSIILRLHAVARQQGLMIEVAS